MYTYTFYETGLKPSDEAITRSIKSELIRRGYIVKTLNPTYYQKYVPADLVVIVNINHPVLRTRIAGDQLDNNKPYAELVNGKLKICDPKFSAEEIECSSDMLLDMPGFYARYFPPKDRTDVIVPTPEPIVPPEPVTVQPQSEEEEKPKKKAKMQL